MLISHLSLRTVCPEGEYQALVSPTEECKVCPGQSSANEEGTDVCKCVETYIRHLSRPDDACIRKYYYIQYSQRNAHAPLSCQVNTLICTYIHAK